MLSLKRPENILLFSKPFKSTDGNFSSGLFTGNGEVGLTVFGEPELDVIVISNHNLFFGGRGGVLPDAFDKVKAAKKLALDNKLNDADSIVPDFFKSKNYKPEPNALMPLSFLKIKQTFDGVISDYKLALNTETSEIAINFKDGKTEYNRSLFVSREDGLVYFEMDKSGSGSINCEFSLEFLETDSISAKYIKLEQNFFIVSAKDENGEDFGVVAKVNLTNGFCENKGSFYKIKDADKVLIVLKTFVKSQKDKVISKIRNEFSSAKFNYDKSLKETTNSISKIKGDYDINISSLRQEEWISTLIDDCSTGKVEPTLVEKLWKYGRFLLICSNAQTQGKMASSGIFSESLVGQSNILKLDGSLQRAYYGVISTGLKQGVYSLAEYYENFYDDLKKNAMRLHGARGIFAPISHTPIGEITLAKSSDDIFRVNGAAFLALLFYGDYINSGDAKYLKNTVLPFMRDVLFFYEDFFKFTKKGLEPYVSFSGNSPLNFYSEFQNKGANLAVSTSVDIVLAKELLSIFISQAKENNLFKTDINRFSELLTNLPAIDFSQECYKEFLIPAMLENYISPALDYLMPVVYGEGIVLDEKSYNSITRSAMKKLQSPYKNAKLYSDIANVLAITKNDEVFSVLGEMLSKCLRPNLTFVASSSFASPNLFNIDVNAGFCSAISNLLVSSTQSTININVPSFLNKFEYILPAKCFCDVNVDFAVKTGLNIKIRSRKTQTIFINVPKKYKKLKSSAVKNFDTKLGILEVNLQENKTATINLI